MKNKLDLDGTYRKRNENITSLIMQALGNHKASKEEIDLIKQYRDNLEK